MHPPLPTPRARLADCVWLPRFIAKARLLAANRLPPEYANRFGAADGVDGIFCRFFNVTPAQTLAAIQDQPDDVAVAQWFLGLPGVGTERVAAWNDFAEKLGQPGHPLAERLKEKLPRMAEHLDVSTIHSVFDFITADERREDL